MDIALPIGNAGVFLVGWSHADRATDLQITCHGAGGEVRITDNWIRRPRPDVVAHLATLGVDGTDEPGFYCFIPLSPVAGPLYLSVSTRAGPAGRVKLPWPLVPEPVPKAVRAVLSMVDPTRRRLRSLMDHHIGPAVGELWSHRSAPRQRAVGVRYGPETRNPPVSIVVPLYGRHDFADYQLALFADDPELQFADLIYVVDDPSIVDEFRRLCPDLYGVHRVPFTFAFPGDNLGFAGATNFGARIAKAPHLLLLNSDVLPREPGWLGALLDVYRAHPDTGLLGAKLLYEDGTVQHAGMVSRRHAPWQDMWVNSHPYKGMSPASLRGVHEVEAVSAACALVETALYRKLGGLSEDYIVGDFEDSDLCHRARRAGRHNRVALDVTLYHLERQSQNLNRDEVYRTGLTLYNCWLHHRRWSKTIAAGADAAETAD